MGLGWSSAEHNGTLQQLTSVLEHKRRLNIGVGTFASEEAAAMQKREAVFKEAVWGGHCVNTFRDSLRHESLAAGGTVTIASLDSDYNYGDAGKPYSVPPKVTHTSKRPRSLMTACPQLRATTEELREHGNEAKVGPITAVKFSTNGFLLAASTTKGYILIFDVETGALVRSIKTGCAAPVLCVAVWETFGCRQERFPTTDVAADVLLLYAAPTPVLDDGRREDAIFVHNLTTSSAEELFLSPLRACSLREKYTSIQVSRLVDDTRCLRVVASTTNGSVCVCDLNIHTGFDVGSFFPFFTLYRRAFFLTQMQQNAPLLASDATLVFEHRAASEAAAPLMEELSRKKCATFIDLGGVVNTPMKDWEEGQTSMSLITQTKLGNSREIPSGRIAISISHSNTMSQVLDLAERLKDPSSCMIEFWILHEELVKINKFLSARGALPMSSGDGPNAKDSLITFLTFNSFAAPTPNARAAPKSSWPRRMMQIEEGKEHKQEQAATHKLLLHAQNDNNNGTLSEGCSSGLVNNYQRAENATCATESVTSIAVSESGTSLAVAAKLVNGHHVVRCLDLSSPAVILALRDLQVRVSIPTGVATTTSSSITPDAILGTTQTLAEVRAAFLKHHHEDASRSGRASITTSASPDPATLHIGRTWVPVDLETAVCLPSGEALQDSDAAIVLIPSENGRSIPSLLYGWCCNADKMQLAHRWMQMIAGRPDGESSSGPALREAYHSLHANETKPVDAVAIQLQNLFHRAQHNVCGAFAIRIGNTVDDIRCAPISPQGDASLTVNFADLIVLCLTGKRCAFVMIGPSMQMSSSRIEAIVRLAIPQSGLVSDWEVQHVLMLLHRPGAPTPKFVFSQQSTCALPPTTARCVKNMSAATPAQLSSANGHDRHLLLHSSCDVTKDLLFCRAVLNTVVGICLLQDYGEFRVGDIVYAAHHDVHNTVMPRCPASRQEFLQSPFHNLQDQCHGQTRFARTQFTYRVLRRQANETDLSLMHASFEEAGSGRVALTSMLNTGTVRYVPGIRIWRVEQRANERKFVEKLNQSNPKEDPPDCGQLAHAGRLCGSDTYLFLHTKVCLVGECH